MTIALPKQTAHTALRSGSVPPKTRTLTQAQGTALRVRLLALYASLRIPRSWRLPEGNRVDVAIAPDFWSDLVYYAELSQGHHSAARTAKGGDSTTDTSFVTVPLSSAPSVASVPSTVHTTDRSAVTITPEQENAQTKASSGTTTLSASAASTVTDNMYRAPKRYADGMLAYVAGKPYSLSAETLAQIESESGVCRELVQALTSVVNSPSTPDSQKQLMAHHFFAFLRYVLIGEQFETNFERIEIALAAHTPTIQTKDRGRRIDGLLSNTRMVTSAAFTKYHSMLRSVLDTQAPIDITTQTEALFSLLNLREITLNRHFKFLLRKRIAPPSPLVHYVTNSRLQKLKCDFITEDNLNRLDHVANGSTNLHPISALINAVIEVFKHVHIFEDLQWCTTWFLGHFVSYFRPFVYAVAKKEHDELFQTAHHKPIDTAERAYQKRRIWKYVEVVAFLMITRKSQKERQQQRLKTHKRNWYDVLGLRGASRRKHLNSKHYAFQSYA